MDAASRKIPAESHAHGAYGADAPLRVILVGRCSLEPRLRLDPALELVRARSPFEAIGELSDPIDGQSPRGAVVLVGQLGEAELKQAGGDSMESLALALRLVDPAVRLLRILPAEQNAPRDPRPFDAIVSPELSAQQLRALALAPRPEPARPQVQVPASRPATLRAVSGVIEPKPGVTGTPPSWDEKLARELAKGKPLVAMAVRMLRTRLRDPDLRLRRIDDPAAAGGVPGGASVVVSMGGRPWAVLSSPRTAELELDAAARWLSAWATLSRQHRQLRVAAFIDPLTGAWNRRYFERYCGAAIARARAGRRNLTVLLFDIDDFKKFNDLYGHPAGDEILVETVRLLRSVVRPTDRVCRIGGDEFAVIFDDPAGPRSQGSQHPEQISEIAGRFQKQIESHRFPKLGERAVGSLTISGGLATLPWDGMSVEELVRKADERALESKRQGKNAITYGQADGSSGHGSRG